MSSLTRPFLAVAITCFLWAATGMAAGPEYAVRLDRPLKKGQEFLIRGSFDYQITFQMAAGSRISKPETEGVRIAMVAIFTAMEVDKEGNLVRGRYEIESLTRTEQGRTEDLLHPATVILQKATEDGHEFRESGQPLEEELAEVLEFFCWPTQHMKEFKAYNPPEAVALGTKWDLHDPRLLDVAMMTRDLDGRQGVTLDEFAAIFKATPEGNDTMLRVGYKATAKDSDYRLQKYPDLIAKLSMVIQVGFDVPDDMRHNIRRLFVGAKFDLRMKNDQGASMKVVVDLKVMNEFEPR